MTPIGLGDLDRAWDRLLGSFKLMVQREELVLTGVSTKTDNPGREQIPPSDAARLHIDPASGAVFVGSRTAYFTGVHVLRRGFSDEHVNIDPPIPVAQAVARLTVDQVAELAPDVVAALLEQHAEHVRTGLRVELAPPGKASVLAMAASMMKHRARAGQLRPTMAEEAEWLSRWAAQVAPSYASLGPKRLQNTLGSLFRDLQAEQLARPAPAAGDVAPK
jgi:hypothetical protein